MNPVHVMLLEICACGLAAMPIACLWDPRGSYFNGLRNLADPENIAAAWLYTAYAFAVMAFLYRVCRLGPMMAEYARRAPTLLPRRTCVSLWWWTFLIAGVCFAVVIVQAGGRMPLVLGIGSGLDSTGVAFLRREVAESTNRNVLNVGLTIALPLNLLLAVAFLRRRWLTLISVGLFLAMATFHLEKGPVAMTLVSLAFFWMLWCPITIRHTWRLAIYAGVITTLVASMFWITRLATSPREVGEKLYARMIYGAISDLPYYFEIFADHPVSPATLLPPYVRPLLNAGTEPTADRLVAEYGRPEEVRLGYAGVSNSFFVGEAFAVGGYPLVFIAPWIVMANVILVVRFFRRLQKTVMTTYAQSLLLFMVFMNLFGGFGGYLFSSFHIILITCFIVRLVTGWGTFRRARGFSPGDPEPTWERLRSPVESGTLAHGWRSGL